MYMYINSMLGTRHKWGWVGLRRVRVRRGKAESSLRGIEGREEVRLLLSFITIICILALPCVGQGSYGLSFL